MSEQKQYKLKNIELAKILKLDEKITYQKGQVVSKTLVQNKNVSITLFSFDKGEEISSHSSDGDAMVTILDGTGKFTVGEEIFLLSKGETLIMPNHVPHAVYGEEQFKMLLTVVF
ncbi:cupin domain-containing protein [Lachnospiraceae bacterium MD1]|uniref:Cupin domain-containing protein n=1 Tax=Variimorphobacter saccharofermentans TaxID=2755051 RepID=A0A839K055_9FIRM|nr:cupin domain-containing protein [Variimorphobacter saccharofermentans]MBB2182582.1 cupin domain-containing protein [Variimorphobacter saccharofermentans]